MSPQPQDADVTHRHRPRANTNTFASFAGWRRGGRPEIVSTPLAGPPQPLSLEELIEALTPPAVPSPINARALATALATNTPLPRPAVLNPVLASLCGVDSPPGLQSAGYDIMSAYWENTTAAPLSTADRISYFCLFLDSKTSWCQEMWESRFRALRALTKSGTEIMGVEVSFLNVLKSWIEGAFEGLLSSDVLDQAERAERERSINIFTASLSSALENPEIVARVPEDELTAVLLFFAELLRRSLGVPSESTANDTSTPSSPDPPASISSTPSRPHTHRRHPSSMSIPSVAPAVPPTLSPPKHPASISVAVYLRHLSSQLKTLSPTYLNFILPPLFHALAFYASPLPRLTITSSFPNTSSPEDRITEMLNALFTGPYAASCMVVLKKYLFPPTDTDESLLVWIQMSTGAHRTLRNYIRRGLCTRLARAYIARESSVGYAPSGAPGHMDLERDLMERAWPKDDVSGWDPAKLGHVLATSVESWIGYNFGLDPNFDDHVVGREKILDEAAGTLKDVLQELDSREDDTTVDDDEATAAGEALYALASYVQSLKNHDGTPFVVPLTQPTDAPSPFLRTLSSLLSRDHTLCLDPLLSTTLLSIADHLTDMDTTKIPIVMYEQHDLSPTSSEWLNNWENIFANRTLLGQSRPLTWQAVMNALQSVYSSVKDMPAYRKPLADLAYNFCQRQLTDEPTNNDSTGDVLWAIMGSEVVLRIVEAQDGSNEGFSSGSLYEGEHSVVGRFIILLSAAASENEEEDDDTVSIATADTHSPSPHASFSVGPSSVATPILSRMQSDYHGPSNNKDSSLPSVMSLLSSFATGHSSRSQSQHAHVQDDSVIEKPATPPAPEDVPRSRSVCAVAALVAIFTELAFTPFALSTTNLNLAIQVYRILVAVLVETKGARARLTVLQFLMRLRADRDHRLYYVDTAYDPDGHTAALASLIQRVSNGVSGAAGYAHGGKTSQDELSVEDTEARKARPRVPQERDGRRASRARGTRPSTSTSSRSRSRVPPIPTAIPSSPTKPREPIWCFPEPLPFNIPEVNTPSEALVSYCVGDPSNVAVLPISVYLSALVGILEKEKNWEILSYVLCHLPVQLSNKHLLCGPRSREVISQLLTVLCAGILNNELGSDVDCWPHGLKVRDAQGLAYHTLSVLISYRRCFDMQLRHLLVEVFQMGLNGQPSTIKCCLHALSLAAFELQPSMTRYLSRILEKLSQIMSSPDMAVHIIGFLSIVGSLRVLHANFTEGDFKMVFGVALRYLQHHNRARSSPTVSWALSQHVRIMSYYLVYVWFLAVKLPDRPRHVRFITRQLLLANEGNDEVDEPTEVCFDWLARYTYASADPRPAKSMLNDVVMNPTAPWPPSEIALSEKSWILGNSIVTIGTLTRLGWIEVVSRRPSGVTKFLCRVENVPMVGPGDVDPDIVSIPATLLMDHAPSVALNPSLSDSDVAPQEGGTYVASAREVFAGEDDPEDKPPVPDPITGYVWSGSAPSQRRKHVAVDPAFFALQLSPYPDNMKSPRNVVVEPSLLPRLFRSLDLMPVIDTHKVGIMYVAPGQTQEVEILRNTHGSPAYTRFLEGIGRLINLRGQADVYVGQLEPDQHGEYAYAWWDDIGQILYHTATMMPSRLEDEYCVNKKRHIGNDNVRIVWNDSGMHYRFDTLATEFQFVNIVIEPHSLGAIAAFSNNLHENEYFKVTVQRAVGMTEFAPVGDFKLISAENLPLLVRQLSLLADWFTSVFVQTEYDTEQKEVMTNWRSRLQAIKKFRNQQTAARTAEATETVEGVIGQEAIRDFTTSY